MTVASTRHQYRIYSNTGRAQNIRKKAICCIEGALMKTIRPIDGVLAVPAVALFSIAMIDYLEERPAFSAISIGMCVVSATLLATIYLISKNMGLFS